LRFTASFHFWKDIVMFLVLLEYQKSSEVMDQYVVAHRAHLATQFAAGKLVMSGPQVPRNGGVIIARLGAREEVDAMMQADPFISSGVATYRAIEFVARATHPELAAFAEELPV
jgi:uncharacterized protein YciI